ncbi:MAG: hypothetical protein IPJ85_16305 [Flavobacteriales bacterium]|nr:hypothetical protein [Flavobacteriales bacterium]
MGYRSGRSTTTNSNTLIGAHSGWQNSTGTLNTFVGTSSGAGNTTGSENTFLGTAAISANTDGACQHIRRPERGPPEYQRKLEHVIGRNAA